MRKELSDSQKVKRELTKRFPDLKFSVTGGYATHTAKIDVAIVEIKNSFINPVKDYDHDIGFVDMENGIQYNGLKTMDLILRGNAHARYGSYTGKTKKVIDEIFSVIEKFYGTYRPGDSMIDSFDNYFYDIDFGKWNKPLIYNGKSIQEIFEGLEYVESPHYPYTHIITTGVPETWESFEELKRLHLEYLLSLMPAAAKKPETKKSKTLSQGDFDFDAIFQNATVEDFEHTKTKEILKVLKLNDTLSRDDFNQFRSEMKERDLGYYSRYAKGFILTGEEIKTKSA